MVLDPSCGSNPAEPLVLLLLVVLVVPAVAGCSSGPRRFPVATPLWDDPDRNDVPSQPEPYYSGLYADAVDKSLLLPVSQAFAFRSSGESRNVNALDEVPNSSWFTNRIGHFPMTPEQAGQGSCRGPRPDEPLHAPWTVYRGKTEGASPGFFVEAADGRRFLLKFDGLLRPERASAADAIGARLYHAAGYFAPCNQVVYFPAEVLAIAPQAVTEDELGQEQPLLAAEVQHALSRAFHGKDGRLRALASELLPGVPLGPTSAMGVRADDPNDVVPHEDRRELRAARLLAAWLDHFDTREQNSLDVWVAEQGRHFVRHYQLDFGDSLGSPWKDERFSRHVGHSNWLDFRLVSQDLLTLGAVRRPWHKGPDDREAEIFAYFGWAEFVPSQWRPIYPNPAYGRMTVRDALWIVRIIARMSDAHLAAIVGQARLSDPRAAKYLLTALIHRRDIILREYLLRYPALDRFRIVSSPAVPGGQVLCFEDLAIRHAGADPYPVVYRVRMMGGMRLEQLLGWTQLGPSHDDPERSCVPLPLGLERPADLVRPGAPDDHPLRYAVLTVYAQLRPSMPMTAVAVHLVDRGQERGFQLIGIERLLGKVETDRLYPDSP